MDKIKLVQQIGNEVCEGCSPDADCEDTPKECFRIQNAVSLLDSFIKEFKQPNKTYTFSCECGWLHLEVWDGFKCGECDRIFKAQQ